MVYDNFHARVLISSVYKSKKRYLKKIKTLVIPTTATRIQRSQHRRRRIAPSRDRRRWIRPPSSTEAPAVSSCGSSPPLGSPSHPSPTAVHHEPSPSLPPSPCHPPPAVAGPSPSPPTPSPEVPSAAAALAVARYHQHVPLSPPPPARGEDKDKIFRRESER